MKRIILAAVLSWACTFAGHAQIAIGTNTPDSSAMLDVFSNSKGLLIPRVALTSANVAAPVTGGVNGLATSLLIYNTATAGSAPNNVKPGFYYWKDSLWYPVLNRGTNVGDMQYWNGSKWIMIPIGQNNQTLTICGGIPQWGQCPQQVLTISPTNNTYEGFISSNNPNSWQWGSDQLLIESWTISGNPLYVRQIIKFDYSLIPAGAAIDSARLYLYADSVPANGNQSTPMAGSNNSCSVSRILSPFILPAGFTWNSPPSVTATNQAIIPQSASSFENVVVDVTGMVKDMLASSNNGFFIRLQTETAFDLNSRQFESSTTTRVNRKPKLIVYYR